MRKNPRIRECDEEGFYIYGSEREPHRGFFVCERDVQYFIDHIFNEQSSWSDKMDPYPDDSEGGVGSEAVNEEQSAG